MFEVVVCNLTGEVLKRYDLSRLASSPGTTMVIGRGEDCDLRIKAGSVSRHHCEVEVVEDDEWLLKDLGSTHGCFVNGERITQVEIEPGLEVQVGPAVLRFESVAARIAEDLRKELGDG